MQRVVDLVLSVLMTVGGFLLSWPFWRDYEYWAESPGAWRIYFVLGFILAVYVFYVFIGSLRMLFQHFADETAAAAAAEKALSEGEEVQ